MDKKAHRKFRWSELSILTKIILTTLGSIFGLLILVVVSYIAYFYLTYIHEDITEGSGYGFTIGQTKQEVYRIAQSKFKDGELLEIEPDLGREEYLAKNLELNKRHKISDVEPWFDQWNHWQLEIEGDDPYLFTVLQFKKNTISCIGLLKKNHNNLELQKEWIAPRMENPPKLVVGQTYKEVYQALLSISREPSYQKLVLSTGWMARRPIEEFTHEEYRLISPYDKWKVYYGGGKISAFNSLEFIFANGKLVSIHRHRQHFELP